MLRVLEGRQVQDPNVHPSPMRQRAPCGCKELCVLGSDRSRRLDVSRRAVSRPDARVGARGVVRQGSATWRETSGTTLLASGAARQASGTTHQASGTT